MNSHPTTTASESLTSASRATSPQLHPALLWLHAAAGAGCAGLGAFMILYYFTVSVNDVDADPLDGLLVIFGGALLVAGVLVLLPATLALAWQRLPRAAHVLSAISGMIAVVSGGILGMLLLPFPLFLLPVGLSSALVVTSVSGLIRVGRETP